VSAIDLAAEQNPKVMCQSNDFPPNRRAFVFHEMPAKERALSTWFHQTAIIASYQKTGTQRTFSRNKTTWFLSPKMVLAQ